LICVIVAWNYSRASAVEVDVPNCQSGISTEISDYFPESAVDIKWVYTIDYRCDDGRFQLSAHDCQLLTPTSQKLEVKQQIRILGITESRINDISMLELMH
jgi:hypothetical protein